MMGKDTFEKDMLRLNEIVAKLEGGECTLDESMQLFEEGIKLSKACNERLESAKQKIVTLSEKENGEA